MSIWAIADLHLSFGVSNKKMDIFGEKWKDHAKKIQKNWSHLISEKDLVLIPGDISWAMHLEEAEIDLDWIDGLPGTKVILRGNHDYWWSSLNKVEKILPSSIHLIQNNAFQWHQYGVCGARLWDTPEYSFGKYIDYTLPVDNQQSFQSKEIEDRKIFERELGRLELSLKSLPKQVKTRIAMTHYPPLGAEMLPSRTSELLEKYHVDICIFGHLHNVPENRLPYGTKAGVRYILVAADYLNFCPVKLIDE